MKIAKLLMLFWVYKSSALYAMDSIVIYNQNDTVSQDILRKDEAVSLRDFYGEEDPHANKTVFYRNKIIGTMGTDDFSLLSYKSSFKRKKFFHHFFTVLTSIGISELVFEFSLNAIFRETSCSCMDQSFISTRIMFNLASVGVGFYLYKKLLHTKNKEKHKI